MAVTTYGELSNIKWVGKIFNNFPGYPERVYLMKLDMISGYIYDFKYLRDDLKAESCEALIINYYYAFNFDKYDIIADSEEELIEYCKAPMLCASNKSITGYKLVQIDNNISSNRYGLCTLEIPPEAQRTSPYFGRKCRADMAKVISINKIKIIYEDAIGAYSVIGDDVSNAYSALFSDNKIEYKVEEYIKSEYDPSRFVECAKGIHFFMTEEEVFELYKKITNIDIL